jgi:branched-chain amino acid transport system substrate-binding protein
MTNKLALDGMARHRPALIPVLVTALAMIAAGCGSSGSSSGASGSPGSSAVGTVTIGSETGLTGADQAVGVPQENGIALAADQINAAGGFSVAGKKYKINIESEDDTSTPTVGVEVVQKLMGGGVHFLLGVLSSDVVQAFLPIVSSQSGLITIASGAALPRLTSYPGIFRSASPTTQDTAMDINFIKQRGWKTIGIFTDRTHAGYVEETPVEDRMLTSIGVKIVDTEEYSIGDTQFGAQLSKMLAKHPQVIDLRGYATDALRIVIQARQLGYTGPIITTSGPIAQEVTQENATKYMSNVYSLSTPGLLEIAGAPAGKYPASTITAAKAMSTAYQARFGQPVGLLSGFSYGTVYVLVKAMQEAGSTTNIPAIRAALEKMTYAAVASHLPEPIEPGAGGLLFQNHDTVSPGSVSIFQNGQFTEVEPISAAYPGVTSG